MTLGTAEVAPDHEVKLETEILYCPRCGCHLRLALALARSISAPQPEPVSIWTAPVPDKVAIRMEKASQANTETLEAIEKRSILRAMKEAGKYQARCRANSWDR